MNVKRVDENRAAKKEDVISGAAVFYIPNDRSHPYDLTVSFPANARLRHDIGREEGEKRIAVGTIVEIVQCEIVDENEILVGFRYDGDEGRLCA